LLIFGNNFIEKLEEILAIDRINLKYNMGKLPLDKRNLNLNAWFSGMTDAEGNFFFSLAGVYFLNNSSSTTINRIKCIYYIKLRIIGKEKVVL
jgi:hypothetical protein